MIVWIIQHTISNIDGSGIESQGITIWTPGGKQSKQRSTATIAFIDSVIKERCDNPKYYKKNRG